MTKVTSEQLYLHLSGDGEIEELADADIAQITAGIGMSEWYLGGDDVVNIVCDVLEAIGNGYKIATWYGPDTEVLICGYRPDQLTVTD